MTITQREGSIGAVVVLAGILLYATGVGSTPIMETVKRDLDGDGVRESVVTMKHGVIQKAAVDYDLDGVQEMTIRYRDGLRDVALLDVDHDTVVDTWVYFYQGVPWKVTEDYDRDGQVDYWMFLRDGKVYAWQQDVNHDGRPDVKTTDGRQKIDANFDGVFERRAVVHRGRTLMPVELHNPLVGVRER